MGRGGAGEGHLQHALLASRHGGHAQAHRVEIVQQPLRLARQEAHAFGQPHSLGVALEEPHPEFGFERVDLLAERRLLNAQRHGGDGQLTGLRRREEVAQLSQIHPPRFRSLCSRPSICRSLGTLAGRYLT